MTDASTTLPASKWRALRWIRRLCQAAFLLLLLACIFLTVAVTGGGFNAASAQHLPFPTEAFLYFDPYAALLVTLATWSLRGALALSLVVLIGAFFLGRAFCGWVCPMGTLNHACSEISPSLLGSRRIRANQSRPYQKTKYFILIGALAAAAFGSAIGALLDPLCLITRGISLTILPWIDYGTSSLLEAATASGGPGLKRAADAAYEAVGGILLYQRGAAVSGGFLAALLWIAALGANRFLPRLWCRCVCPLGALLALLGRFGIFSLKKEPSRCTSCGKCDLHCSGAASPRPGQKWQRAECDLCLNCVASCPENALTFGLAGRAEESISDRPDLGRRAVGTAVATGFLVVPALRTLGATTPQGRPDPDCIRPPGAVAEEAFLASCIRCGQCMKACPTGALHPAFHEAGLEGVWTPVLVPRLGYCEPTCTLCTQVCPTGALRPLLESHKTGKDGAPMVRLGTAFIDRGRCLPWAMGTPCIVCEEFCPVTPKAIHFEQVEEIVDGRTVQLSRPFVSPSRCNGCGACEYVCPVHDRAAIRVSAAGQSRDPRGGLLLEPKHR